jgi:hypothetical protein
MWSLLQDVGVHLAVAARKGAPPGPVPVPANAPSRQKYRCTPVDKTTSLLLVWPVIVIGVTASVPA